MTKQEILKSIFGHEDFRTGQETLIDELLSGRDVLGVMPTGAGKSVCYQVPALLMEGLTLVISPLISLMKDQVMALKASGVAAAFINSSLTPGQQQEAIRRARNGAYKIVYVAPERLDTPQFLDFATSADIALIAVDEAHCVSQWGQDFRPSYLRIAEFVQKLPKRPPVGAFTATATKQVMEDIARMLCLQDPFRLTTGFNRPNLHFTCVKPSNKFTMLYSFLETMRDACGIIYCSTRKNVEEVTEKLRLGGFSATRYHAGLGDAERRDNQDDFQFDRAQIMVATNAFGMGIDKSNVRFVVHYNMPKNIESYYQEAGRAGRDGEPAECMLLYSGQDVILAKWLIEHGDDNPELTEEQKKAIYDLDMQRLKQMTFYANFNTCLRHFILRYFGEYDVPKRCDNCSVCDGDAFEVDTGSDRQPRGEVEHAVSRMERQMVKEVRRASRASVEANYNGWEMALFENLKTLRSLLAARQHAPAYTIFSDASLHDMIKKRPTDMDAFLGVSGVGRAKQEQYGDAFLCVIRDGVEPNEALERIEVAVSYRERLAKQGITSAFKAWETDEDEQLRVEFENDTTYAEMSRLHGRTGGAIKARLKKLGLIEDA
ncbi:MAG: RecQ family ATP-dependent DNA helicase [Clostridia bacterium]